jgi:hypothetical protein
LLQPQPSLPSSKVLMLYFFMQSGQTLCPEGILALQKVHTAVAFSFAFAAVLNDLEIR